MKKFVVTTHDNEKYITSKYSDIDNLHSNAWLNEGVVVCDSAIISTRNVKLIEPLHEEFEESTVGWKGTVGWKEVSVLE